MKYASMGASIVDNIVRLDGSRQNGICGGMGVYAYTGIRLFTDDALLFTGVGDDFDDYYGSWLRRNNVPRDGLIRRHEHTMNIVLSYDGDKGGYVTHSIYGDDAQREIHQRQLNLTGEHLEPYAGAIDWLYLGCEWLKYRPGIAELKERYGFKVMWETDSRIGPDYLGIFERHLPFCDIFSFNRSEAFAMFGVNTDEKVIDIIRDTGKPCYYRAGTDGAFMVTESEAAYIPMISIKGPGDDIDPTGCGNTSTGAAMWAFGEGCDPLMVGVLAAVAAGYNALQNSFIPDLSAVRAEAFSRAEAEYARLSGGRPPKIGGKQ